MAHATNLWGRFLQHLILQLRHFIRRVLYRLDDVLVSGASAHIARNSPPNFLLARVRIIFQERTGRHDHPWCTEPALQPMLFLESFLYRMEFAVLGHTFDGTNLATVRLHGKDSTGFYRPAIQQDCAGTAICRVATHVRSGQHQDFTDKMDQEKPWLDLSLVIPAVHLDANMFFGSHNYLAGRIGFC